MAIGATTLSGDKAGQAASAPTFHRLISFLGDTSYPANGTIEFEAKVQAILKNGEELLYIVPEDCGGYMPLYDKSADKLKVYESGADGGPNDEVTATTALNGVTFNIWVVTK